MSDSTFEGWPAEPDRLLLMFQALRPEEAETFLALVAQVLPHSHPELVAARVATALSFDATLVDGLALRALVLGGLADLDGRARAAAAMSFAQLGSTEQAGVLAGAEDSAFFQTVIHLVKHDFYNRHIVWDVLGYPDLTHEAGYLDDGFDRLDA